MTAAVRQAKIIERAALAESRRMRVVGFQIRRRVESIFDVSRPAAGHVVRDVVFVGPYHRGAGRHGQRGGIETAGENPNLIGAAHIGLQRIFAATPLRQRERSEQKQQQPPAPADQFRKPYGSFHSPPPKAQSLKFAATVVAARF